jgi:Protein of unknown function (DUF3341)
MTDENDKTKAGLGPPPDAPKTAEPAEAPHVTPGQAAVIKQKVADAAAQVAVAVPETHLEHIDHVLTRRDPVKPVERARVRLAYSEGGDEPLDGPSEPSARLKPCRVLAEYGTTKGIIHAAETLRDAGYKAFEAHSPFPIHGMDEAMGLKDSRLGWIVLACGLTGVSSAWLMMFWMNGVDYPLIIGGKPPGALPSMVPIMFELTVLLSSFGAVLGMFGLNRLPQHHDPLFFSDRFAKFSNDKFFLSVESGDPKFDVERTRALLEKTHPEAIEIIETTEEVKS